MARVCTVCGKGPITGNNVSHANNRTKRRWYPNLQTVRVLVDGAPRRVRVCTQCMKSNRVVKAPRTAIPPDASQSRRQNVPAEKRGPEGPLLYFRAPSAAVTREQLDPGDVRPVTISVAELENPRVAARARGEPRTDLAEQPRERLTTP